MWQVLVLFLVTMSLGPGTLGLSCYNCTGMKCKSTMKFPCDNPLETYCLEVAYYASSMEMMMMMPPDLQQLDYPSLRSKVQIKKMCASRMDVDMECRKAHMMNGFCDSCQYDGCNNTTRKGMITKLRRVTKTVG